MRGAGEASRLATGDFPWAFLGVVSRFATGDFARALVGVAEREPAFGVELRLAGDGFTGDLVGVAVLARDFEGVASLLLEDIDVRDLGFFSTLRSSSSDLEPTAKSSTAAAEAG